MKEIRTLNDLGNVLVGEEVRIMGMVNALEGIYLETRKNEVSGKSFAFPVILSKDERSDRILKTECLDFNRKFLISTSEPVRITVTYPRSSKEYQKYNEILTNSGVQKNG